MKKYLFIILFILTDSFVLFSQQKEYKLRETSNGFSVTDNSFQVMSFSNTISSLTFVDTKTDIGDFIELKVDNYIKDYTRIGKPQLPVLNKLIEIPQDAVVEVKVVSYSEESIDLSALYPGLKIMPTQPSVSKGIDPSDVKFSFDQGEYLKDQFNDSRIAEVTVLGTMRGTRLGRLTIEPFVYNPAGNILKVYNNLVVEVRFTGANASKTASFKKKYYSPYFQLPLTNVVNYTASDKDTMMRYPVKYVIVADSMFRTALQPFIRWKVKKGFNVIQAYTSDPNVGKTTTSIHNYLEGLYNSATESDPAPSFALFVGDVAQIPASNGTTAAHPTDLYYCEFTGDYFPEMYYGRFSANNLTELQPQIDKTLEYEQFLMPDPSYLDTAVFIAGDDNSGGAYSNTYGNGQVNYATTYYFNQSHDIYSNAYLYPRTSSDSTAVRNSIASKLSSGVGFANYSAHGSPAGWATPSFVVSDVHNMTNNDRFGLMVGNCCQTNTYSTTECFGEALLRMPGKGAIGYIGATDDSYWDEDFYFAVGVKPIVTNPIYNGNLGYFDRTFHDHGEPQSEWYASQGQALFAGCLAVTESGSGYSKYYWEIYQLMGDPSLMPYYSVPVHLTATYDNPVAVGTNYLQVSTLPGAYVALSLHDTLLDARLADNSGVAILHFNPFPKPDTADIVVTVQNCSPFVGTLRIIQNTGPYLSLVKFIVNDSTGNNDGIADYNENIKLNISLKNFGISTAKQVVVKFRTTDTCVVINDSLYNWGNILSDSISNVTNAFSITVKNHIPDQHIVYCNLYITDSLGNTWNSYSSFVLDAPVLTITSIFVNDSAGNNNHRLDDNETAKICIVVKNSGHSLSPGSLGKLNSVNQYISFMVDSVAKGNVQINHSDTFTFVVNVIPPAPVGSVAVFDFNLFADSYSLTKRFYQVLNQMVEDWEDSSFNHGNFHWVNTSNKPWVIVTGSNVYQGKFSARSGAISDNETSLLSLNITVALDDTLSFYKKVSCEQGYNGGSTYQWYDYLGFYIDGTSVGRWDGEVAWSLQSYLLPAGNHTLLWLYLKDYSTAAGSDCAWIDMINFRPVAANAVQNLPDLKDGIVIFPDPFVEQTDIRYSLGNRSSVSLSISDYLGRLVDEPFANELQQEGTHDFIFNAKKLKPGVYICKLMVNNSVYYNKMIIVSR